MSDIIIATDDDVRLTSAAQSLADVPGQILAQVYPGYRWRVTPYPHPTRPFFDIQLEAGATAFGATIKPWEHPTASMLRKEIITRGGELLEAFHLNRRAFDEAEFIGRKKNFAGIVVPDWI